MQNLLQFLKSQKAIVISTTTPWSFTVYFANSEVPIFYFASDKKVFHSTEIEKDPRVSFATFWHDENDLKTRKGIQGVGKCSIADVEEINEAVKLYNEKYPDSVGGINVESMNDPKNDLKIFKIEPEFIKYWDDRLYGEEKTKEFRF